VAHAGGPRLYAAALFTDDRFAWLSAARRGAGPAISGCAAAGSPDRAGRRAGRRAAALAPRLPVPSGCRAGHAPLSRHRLRNPPGHDRDRSRARSRLGDDRWGRPSGRDRRADHTARIVLLKRGSCCVRTYARYGEPSITVSLPPFLPQEHLQRQQQPQRLTVIAEPGGVFGEDAVENCRGEVLSYARPGGAEQA